MKPPKHFTLILGRIGHLSLGGASWTLCGRKLPRYSRKEEGLTAREARRRVDCRVCKTAVLP